MDELIFAQRSQQMTASWKECANGRIKIYILAARTKFDFVSDTKKAFLPRAWSYPGIQKSPLCHIPNQTNDCWKGCGNGRIKIYILAASSKFDFDQINE